MILSPWILLAAGENVIQPTEIFPSPIMLISKSVFPTWRWIGSALSKAEKGSSQDLSRTLLIDSPTHVGF